MVARSYRLTLRQAKSFRCTAEHLMAKRDGGSDDQENIVAACWVCNHTRHRRKRPPEPRRWKTTQAPTFW